MSVSSVSGPSMIAALAATGTRAPQPPAPVGESSGPSFTERMQGALEQVSEAQNQASDSARAFETGATDDLAAVMVDQQISSLGFQMTLQVRNKALTAYRDIMNMPV